MNRRTVLKNLSVLGIASVANPVAAKTPNPHQFNLQRGAYKPEEIKELAPGVFFSKGKLEYFKSGNFKEVECNNGWVVFDDFVVVIDANFPDKAKMLLQEIRKTTPKPIRYVFNTHHHGDHVYANRLWFNQGAAIVSHAGVIHELRKYETGYYSHTPGRWEEASEIRLDLKDFPLLPPSITFTEKLVIEDKNRRLELLHLAPGHTKGDAVAWLPQEKILFTGDSCLNGPYNLFRDAEVVSWIGALDKMQRLEPHLFVPGHGDLGNAEAIKDQQDFFKVLYRWVEAKKQAGEDLTAIRAKLPELRSLIKSDDKIKRFLIADPAVLPAFSLEAQTQKIFEQIL